MSFAGDAGANGIAGYCMTGWFGRPADFQGQAALSGKTPEARGKPGDLACAASDATVKNGRVVAQVFETMNSINVLSKKPSASFIRVIDGIARTISTAINPHQNVILLKRQYS